MIHHKTNLNTDETFYFKTEKFKKLKFFFNVIINLLMYIIYSVKLILNIVKKSYLS